MIDSTRLQLLEKLKELSELAPDYRFGQMICNLAHSARGGSPSDAWDAEDAELLAALDRQIADWKKLQEPVLVESP